MNDAPLMRGFEGVGDLLGDGQGFVYWDCPLRDALSQRRPFNQLQHQRPYAVLFFQAVDASDVGMVQRGKDSGFTLEPGQSFRIVSEEVREDFQGHIAPELGIVRTVHLPHAALANLGSDFVRAERGAGLQGHSASHHHFFRALRRMGPNTIRAMIRMTSNSPIMAMARVRAL